MWETTGRAGPRRRKGLSPESGGCTSLTPRSSSYDDWEQPPDCKSQGRTLGWLLLSKSRGGATFWHQKGSTSLWRRARATNTEPQLARVHIPLGLAQAKESSQTLRTGQLARQFTLPPSCLTSLQRTRTSRPLHPVSWRRQRLSSMRHLPTDPSPRRTRRACGERSHKPFSHLLVRLMPRATFHASLGGRSRGHDPGRS